MIRLSPSVTLAIPLLCCKRKISTFAEVEFVEKRAAMSELAFVSILPSPFMLIRDSEPPAVLRFNKLNALDPALLVVALITVELYVPLVA